MSGAELFGLIVSLALFVYLAVRAVAGRAAVTAQGWLQIALVPRSADGTRAAGGRLHGAGVPERDGCSSTPVLALSSGSTYRLLRVNPNGSRTGRPTGARVVVFSVMFWLALYVILRTQGIHPFNPEGFNSAPWDVTLQHDLVVRDQHELAVLRRRDHHDVLLPDGRSGGAELRLGRGRDGGAGGGDPWLRDPAACRQLGNFWQDLTRTLLYILLPLSIIGAVVLMSQGVVQTLSALRVLLRRSRASTRRSLSGRRRRRSRSSSSGRTAAASST